MAEIKKAFNFSRIIDFTLKKKKKKSKIKIAFYFI